MISPGCSGGGLRSTKQHTVGVLAFFGFTLYIGSINLERWIDNWLVHKGL